MSLISVINLCFLIYVDILVVADNRSLHSAAIVQLVDGEEDSNSAKLKQFVVKCEHNDRFLIIYTLLKLGPISGKVRS